MNIRDRSNRSESKAPRILLRFSCLLLIAISFSSAALAHPGHVTSAEAEYNSKSRSLEVALEVDLNDLETALRATSGKRVVLEKTKDLDQLLEKYLRKHFTAKLGKESFSKLKWVGKEIKAESAWLYFELPLPRGVEGVELSHQVFFDSLPGQINTIRLRSGERRTTLSFTEKSPRQIVSFKQRDSKKKKQGSSGR